MKRKRQDSKSVEEKSSKKPKTEEEYEKEHKLALKDIKDFHSQWNDGTTLTEKIKLAVKSVLERIGNFKPEVGLVLGSGLNALADKIENPIKIPYDEIPYFPCSTFDKEKSVCFVGMFCGRRVITMKYRTHYYEGYNQQQITFPIRVMSRLGAKNLLLTNACGSVDVNYNPGDFMLLKDHINFSGANPLVGYNFENLGKRFIDMSNAYHPELNKKVKDIANRLIAQGEFHIKDVEKKIDLKIQIHEGVYCMFSGPSYETPTEVQMAGKMGASVVGMSTVPECIVANHEGMNVTAISLVTNKGAGLGGSLCHKEVMETANLVKPVFTKLVKAIIPILKYTQK